MNLRRRRIEAAERVAERRRREDAAPRLREQAPGLTSLKLEIEEGGSKHVRLIVLERAPALFAIPCGDPTCEGGGYDITSRVMQGLEARESRFEAEDRCLGTVGTTQCTRTLRAIALAQYKPA